MSSIASFDPQEATERLFALLKSVAQYDETEIRGVLKSLLSPTPRETCFLACLTGLSQMSPLGAS